MIVSELIKELTKLPQNMTVLQHGYEGGYNEMYTDSVEKQTLVKCDTPWYEGDYQYADVPDFWKRLDTPKEYICLG